MSQLKLTEQANVDAEASLTKKIDDDIVFSVDCMFYRQYQLLCKHMWQYHLIYDVFTLHDWDRWIFMFENGEFEIYESITKEYVIKDVHEAIGAPDKRLLEI